MDFGDAIRALKTGKRVAREGWNGKGMWLGIVEHYDPLREGADGLLEPAAPFGVRKLPWIGMRTAQGDFVPWLASQTDVLSEDWELVA